VLRLAQQKEREGAGIPGGCARRRQRAGRRQDKWRRRSVVAAREGRAREERVREKGKVQETEGGDEREALSPEREGCQ
jgi:hypothetical protein